MQISTLWLDDKPGHSFNRPSNLQGLYDLSSRACDTRASVGDRMKYDAILVTSFGGPESSPDVLPFLENVLRGKNVPRERMLEVAEHYYHFGGKSPINDQNRQLIAALEEELAQHGHRLPVYWGNRNWHPMLVDTLRKMQADGVHRALAFVTSAYSSYSSCRQYREDIARARETVGEGAPAVDKIRVFHNHPGFIEAVTDQVNDALGTIPQDRREAAHLIYTAHSIPMAMAQSCDYETQLRETCRLVTGKLGRQDWRLVYQSRSGPPSQPWLEPDILACLREIKGRGGSADVVISPIGFVSDHMEILFDLDTEAAELCAQLGLHMVRARTVGTHPSFIRMIRELICERMDDNYQRAVLGVLGPRPDVCPAECCPLTKRPEAGTALNVSSKRSDEIRVASSSSRRLS
jgi:protoporphyrin/coproporphyrin ferrochelatase